MHSEFVIAANPSYLVQKLVLRVTEGHHVQAQISRDGVQLLSLMFLQRGCLNDEYNHNWLLTL